MHACGSSHIIAASNHYKAGYSAFQTSANRNAILLDAAIKLPVKNSCRYCNNDSPQACKDFSALKYQRVSHCFLLLHC